MDAAGFNALFRREVEEKTRASREKLINGMVEDFAEYKFHCGFVKGMDAAVDAHKKTMKRLENHEEEEDA